MSWAIVAWEYFAVVVVVSPKKWTINKICYVIGIFSDARVVTLFPSITFRTPQRSKKLSPPPSALQPSEEHQHTSNSRGNKMPFAVTRQHVAFKCSHCQGSHMEHVGCVFESSIVESSKVPHNAVVIGHPEDLQWSSRAPSYSNHRSYILWSKFKIPHPHSLKTKRGDTNWSENTA